MELMRADRLGGLLHSTALDQFHSGVVVVVAPARGATRHAEQQFLIRESHRAGDHATTTGAGEQVSGARRWTSGVDWTDVSSAVVVASRHQSHS
jgi:hypothetical protein